MRTAFKEWAVVVDALGRGEQSLILRKGGISEGPDGFKVDHERFILLPTLFHQQRESVIPTAQIRYDALRPDLADPEVIRIEYFAEVVSWHQLESLEDAKRLRPFHIWRDEVVSERFEWGKQKNIFALIVRVYQLAQPWEVPMIPAYGGCKSWVELENDVPLEGSEPVIEEAAFEAQLALIQGALISSKV